MSKALILVDVQNDFAPGGALAVPEGDRIVPVINSLLPLFDHVIATKDWHPKGHASFASANNQPIGSMITLNGFEQVMWPDHCIQESHGADFIPGLNSEFIAQTIYKGTNPNIDSYSGFFDNQRLQQTGLEDYLRSCDIDTIYIVGLATDYCVKFTALDAISLNFNTYLIKDACRGVNMQPGDDEQAIAEMHAAGVKIIHSNEVNL
ncbi:MULTISPECIES: bifunctional nicotinamidase/pyrazinamidase [Vibrio]|uniref:Nicotinamidase n=2 Tax=Vibrio TaxID=662 RepID=A0A7X4LME5_9VIBR|nr:MULTISPECIES: bifunctional nicotinamidase/pyrazinamidase [Vibrio]MBF9002993.1 bifunctional nicotinamidase/pyrazinamidase [Vibrio nitrifigilis]MZI94564.1 bifunctional nicotinamidase/pyrazinamidase [Vibrio eleionomae]